MTKDNDLREVKIPSHWSAKQEAYYYEQLEKLGFKVIVATTSEKIPTNLFNK